ncbi:DNA-directed RNA polymerase subunit alpha C-terminal domain-containing protein [Algoriphagus pacificus]|uniref:RNA polymerase alpha subunit C-terminal domain-containing protein n=1 Tax=Algoriphagus pacificus TaxID=2811234 RepID=A0ABS3CKR9_9BACT|nr:DNA-directed RNA polymerase subunit alpha C-terminal domain-containing protein [Algoriphagus pacificus]MBN7817692.1 hypothetical protein [Algoriphagus pacificus]
MISNEILRKLTIEELAALKEQVEKIFEKKMGAVSNEVRYSEISERCKKVLEENNIQTWNQLAKNFTKNEIQQLRNCSSKTLLEIFKALDQRGINLKP